MSEPKGEMIKPMAVEALASPQHALRDALQALVKVNSKGIYHESSCQFCQSPSREEAEQLYAKPVGAGDRYLQVKALLDSRNDNLSIDVIRNHIDNHLNRAALELLKLEYMNHLTAIANHKLSSLESANFMMAVLRERVAAVATIPDNCPKLIEMKVKATTSIAKAYAQQTEIRAKILGEMAGQGELVAIPKLRFIQAMESALQSVKDPAEQQVILKLFEEMDRTSEE